VAQAARAAHRLLRRPGPRPPQPRPEDIEAIAGRGASCKSHETVDIGFGMYRAVQSPHALVASVTYSKSRPTSARLEHRPRGHDHPKYHPRVNAQYFHQASMRCVSASRRRPDVHSARVVRCHAIRLRVVCDCRCRAAKSNGIPSAPRQGAVLELFGCASDHRTHKSPLMLGRSLLAEQTLCRRGLGRRLLFFVIIFALTSEKGIDGRRGSSSQGK